jgi:hypothetical protein
MNAKIQLSKKNKVNILVIAQLALGDSEILRSQFLERLSCDIGVTVLCNSYNEFIFSAYERFIENWPIARNRPWGRRLFSRKIDPSRYNKIVLPSSHFRELLYARARFNNKKLLVAHGGHFFQMQKNDSKLSRIGLDSIELASDHWYSMYTEFAAKVNAFFGESASKPAISRLEVLHRGSKYDDVLVAPHSNDWVKYKWLPDSEVRRIVLAAKQYNLSVIIITDKQNGCRALVGDKVRLVTPQVAVESFSSQSFRVGFFCESFLAHFFAPKVRAQFIYDSGVDPFHKIAAPPSAVLFSSFNDSMLESGRESRS